MWSVYDTLVLVTGLLTAAIALIPVEAIEKKTRLTSLFVGGGLVLLSLYLGSLTSFSYPSLVMIAPVIPLVAAGAIIKHAKDVERFRASQTRSQGEDRSAQERAIDEGSSVSLAPLAPELSASAREPGSRELAWVELFSADTPASRLAVIAAEHPEFASQIAGHPNCYPELRAWAEAALDTTGDGGSGQAPSGGSLG